MSKRSRDESDVSAASLDARDEPPAKTARTEPLVSPPPPFLTMTNDIRHYLREHFLHGRVRVLLGWVCHQLHDEDQHPLLSLDELRSIHTKGWRIMEFSNRRTEDHPIIRNRAKRKLKFMLTPWLARALRQHPEMQKLSKIDFDPCCANLDECQVSAEIGFTFASGAYEQFESESWDQHDEEAGWSYKFEGVSSIPKHFIAHGHAALKAAWTHALERNDQSAPRAMAALWARAYRSVRNVAFDDVLRAAFGYELRFGRGCPKVDDASSDDEVPDDKDSADTGR